MITVFISGILCFFFLMFLAFANCAETAFTCASDTWMEEQVRAGNKRAEIALYYLNNPDKFLLFSLLNANLWNVSLVTVAQAAMAIVFVKCEFFAQILSWMGATVESRVDEILTSIVITVIGLIFAEILPKAIARTIPNRTALWCAVPLDLSAHVLKYIVPINLILSCSHSIAQFLGIKETKKEVVTRDDLRELAQAMEEQGVVKGDVGDMFESVLDMNTKPVKTVMVPLINITSVSITATLDEVENLSSATGFIWFPVYGSRHDQVVGLVNLRHACQQLEGLPDDKASKETVEKYMEDDLLYVPDTMTLSGLHDVFAGRTTPAFVVNEFGGVVGLITREDLILSIAGWVNNTRAKEAYSRIDRTAPNVFECDGRIDIREIEDELGVDIDDEDTFSTGAGLVMMLAGRIPKIGEEFKTPKFTVRVLDADSRCVKRLRFNNSSTPSPTEKKP